MSKSHDYFRKGISRCNPALYKRNHPRIAWRICGTNDKLCIIILKVGKEGKEKPQRFDLLIYFVGLFVMGLKGHFCKLCAMSCF